MSDLGATDVEARNRALRHSIYKEGVCQGQHVRDGVITEESLRTKGFVKDADTGDWQRPRKDA